MRTGSLVGRIDTRRQQRTVRWVLQALIVGGGIGSLGAGFLLSAVLPLLLALPIRPLMTPRARFAGYAASLLWIAYVGFDPSHLVGDLESILAAGTQSGLVFVAAFALSRSPIRSAR